MDDDDRWEAKERAELHEMAVDDLRDEVTRLRRIIDEALSLCAFAECWPDRVQDKLGEAKDGAEVKR